MRPPVLDLGLGEMLDADPRPSFIVDVGISPPSVIYRSPALAAHGSLNGPVGPPSQQNAELWEWVNSLSSEPRSHGGLSLAGVLWTVIVVQTWLVISANEQPLSVASRPKDAVGFVVSAAPVSPSPPPPSSNSGSVSTVGGNSGSSASSTLKPAEPADKSASLEPPPLIDRRANSTPGEILPSVASAVSTVEAPVPGTLRRATTDPGWIVPDIVPEQRPFLDVINSVNWAATPLGPMSTWTPRLQQTVNQILADSRAIAVYWGEHYSTIYNEAFSRLCGSKHPFLLGRPVEETWPGGGAVLKEAMRISAEKSTASVEDEWRHFVERRLDDGREESCWLQEVYLKWSVVPLFEGTHCLGFMHPVVETTSMRLWERRMKMLIELGDALVTPRDIKSYWATIIDKLGAVEPRYDIPFAILYSVDDDPSAAGDASRKYESTKICRLEGSLGVPDGDAIITPTLPLWSSDRGLSSMFREALTTPNPLLLETETGSLPKSLIDGLRCRGFGDPCRAAVVLPIRPTKLEDTMGLLVIGLSPRRPYDNDYRQYISLLSQKITTSLASTVLLEEETRRGRNMAEQAAYDHAMLKEKLAAQTKEANESIRKFEAVAEFIPVGMCFGDNQGKITFANDAFCRITGLTREGLLSDEAYLPCVAEQDRDIVTSAYEDLQTRQSITFEFRVKPQDLGHASTTTPPTRNSPSFERAGLDLVSSNRGAERHVLASAKAERAPDGTIVRVLTCLTDVTLHKQTAEEAVRRAQQAENLKRMAEFATVGMYDMDLHGRLLGANRVFFEMCGIEPVDPAVVEVRPWENCIDEDDLPMLREKFRCMTATGKVQNLEVRFNNSWVAEDGAGHTITATRWVQATLMPVKDSDGAIKSFTGCLSDVSLQKWQLEREKERKEEAIESRRQQENFIDVTSHEMRNPLSAIIHCADAVTATLSNAKELVAARSSAATLAVNSDAQSQDDGAAADVYSEEQDIIDGCIENAEIIVTCAQHQKRIVDDILTMSKLDSQLLAITPVTVNTIDVVQEALKMFEVEAKRVDIDLDLVVHQSYHDLGLAYLEFDPSRLKQVLINLLTNALKFTKTGPTRSVTVTMSASRTRPTDANSEVQFIPRAKEPDSEDPGPDERTSDGPTPIWLMFEVKDTGQGLTPEEMKSLFQRFVQASSRTHIKYGGSGLGLFISRRLTELQNGAIGVASSPGVGSTFAFYIEACVPSDDAVKEAVEAAAAARQFAASTALHPLARISRLGSTTTADRPTPASSSRNSPALGALPRAPQSSLGAVQSTPSLPTEIEGVLVVEDNIINQHITRRGLKDYYHTEVANHGIEALEKVRRSNRYIDKADEPPPQAAPSSPPSSPLPSPILERNAATDTNNKSLPGQSQEDPGGFPLSVILMDIEMPVQDGLTCTRHIREMEAQGRIRGGRIPIIAVSANARAEQVQEAREAGCDGVLVKPFRMHELLAKMEAVVREVARGAQGG